jgi:hypothetical protein
MVFMKRMFESLSCEELHNVRGGLAVGKEKPPPDDPVIVDDIDIWIPVVL